MLINVEQHPVEKNIFVTKDGEVFKRVPASISSAGYHTVKMPSGKTIRRHTLVLETYKGFSGGRVARHLDGDASNDSESNLEWGSQRENMQDAIRHGTTTKGSKNAQAKMTESDVLEIRARYDSGDSRSAMAREYAVSTACIHDIGRRRTWGWL